MHARPLHKVSALHDIMTHIGVNNIQVVVGNPANSRITAQFIVDPQDSSSFIRDFTAGNIFQFILTIVFRDCSSLLASSSCSKGGWGNHGCPSHRHASPLVPRKVSQSIGIIAAERSSFAGHSNSRQERDRTGEDWRTIGYGRGT